MTRFDNDVILSHDDAEQLSKILSDYADMCSARAEKADKARNVAAANMYRRSCADARNRQAALFRALWTWSDLPHVHGAPVRAPQVTV